MKKISAKIMSVALAVSSCIAAVGCGGGGKVSDTEQTLQVYVFEAGYGTKWCTDMLDLFKEQGFATTTQDSNDLVFFHPFRIRFKREFEFLTVE